MGSIRNPRLTKYRGRWSAYWRDDRGPHRISLRLDPSEDRETAQAAFDEWLSRLAKPGTATTCDAVFDHYLEDRRIAQKVVSSLEHALKPVRAAWGLRRPESIAKEDARLYLQRRAGRSNGTIRKELQIARAAFALAVDDGLMDRA